MQKELREIKLKRQYLNANAAIVEEKAWISQQEGAQREIKVTFDIIIKLNCFSGQINHQIGRLGKNRIHQV